MLNCVLQNYQYSALKNFNFNNSKCFFCYWYAQCNSNYHKLSYNIFPYVICIMVHICYIYNKSFYI